LSSIFNQPKGYKNNFMNHYQLTLDGANVDKNSLRVVGLMYIASSDLDIRSVKGESGNVQDAQSSLVASLTISLANFPTSGLVQTAYCSEYQQTVDSFDKSVITTGDIVVAYAATAAQQLSIVEFYDQYTMIPVYNKGVLGAIYIGESNSAKSQFHEPFAGISQYIIISPSKVEALAEGAEFTV
jgi:hypothetical protein